MQPTNVMTCLARGIRQAMPASASAAQTFLAQRSDTPKFEPQPHRFFSTSHRALSDQMLDPARFYKAVKKCGVHFFCGVPDSLLKDFCAYVTSNSKSEKDHVITCNEGAGVALAAGYYLATGSAAMVYLQNSGVGNMVNPLMSLADPAVYSIPMLLLIGWRGEPGVKDEPQHVAQGRITPAMFDCMGIPYAVLPKDESEMIKVLQRAEAHFEEHRSAFALLVQTKTFAPYALNGQDKQKFCLTREEALYKVVECLGEKDAIVSTSGMLSRELFELRVAKNQGHARDFLTVGSMGHASAIAFGIALQKPGKQIFCFDGDGATLMHMGSLATVGQQGPENLKHIVFNNGAHDSVGGQPTEAGNHDSFNLQKIAQGCGYRETLLATTEQEILDSMEYLLKAKGPILLELKVLRGSRKNLGRPTTTTHENKKDFMDFLHY